MALKIFFLLAALVLCAMALPRRGRGPGHRPQQGRNCPNPVQCDVNPCDGAVCKQDENAVCLPNNCGGCRAIFFNGEGKVIESCSDPSVQPSRKPRHSGSPPTLQSLTMAVPN